MIRTLKWLLIGLSTIIGIAVCLAIWLVISIDLNSFKPELESAAAKQGATLQIKGDISWQFIPNLAIELGNTQLNMPDKGLESLQFQSLKLALDKKQLLKRNISFDTIYIDGANMVARSAKTAGETLAAPIATNATKPSPDASFTLEVSHLIISNSKLELLADNPIKLDELNLELHNINLNKQPFPVSFSGQTVVNNTPLKLSLKSEIAIDLGVANASLNDLLEQSEKLIDQLAIDLPRLEITGSFGTLPFNAQSSLSYQNDQLSLKKLMFEIAELTAQANLEIAELTNNPSAAGNIQLSSSNLDELLKGFEVESHAPVSNINIASKLTASSSNIALNDLTLKLDQQTLKGKLSLDLTPPKNFNLVLSGDTFTIPESQPAQATNTETTQSAADGLLTALLGPLALLEGGKGQVELNLNTLQAVNIPIQQFHINAQSSNNIVRITDVSGNVFQGSFKAKATIDLTKAQPQVQFEKYLTNINLKDTLTSLADYQDLQGTLHLDFKGTSQGDSVDALQANATGNGSFVITKPTLNKLNIEQSVCKATAVFSTTQQAPQNTNNFTVMEDLTSNIAIGNNIVSLSGLNTKTGNLQLKAKGDINLANEDIDLLLSGNIAGNTTSETGCSVNKRLRNVDIPIRCKGTISGELSCRPDQDWINKLMQKALLDEVSNRLFKNKDQPPSEETETEKPAKKTDIQRAEEAFDLLKGLLK